MMNPLIRPWRQLFKFTGRATRTEYALYHVTALFALIGFEFVLGMVMALTLGIDDGRANMPNVAVTMTIGFVFLALFVMLFIGHVSVSVRRLHDQGTSGWLYLLTYLPLVGFVFWLVLIFKRGDEHENAHGFNPRHGEQVGVDELSQVFS